VPTEVKAPTGLPTRAPLAHSPPVASHKAFICWAGRVNMHKEAVL
jgi:hypothetical protein